MIKVLIPSMPTAEELLPYLRRIDETQIYTNNGPLVQELERQLLAYTGGVPCVVVSSGTAALELVFQALREFWSYEQAMLPAVTFNATGWAALRAGLRVALEDVDPATYKLRPPNASQQEHPQFPKRVFVPVAAFGSAVPLEEWEELNKAVVIDAAGALGSQRVSTSLKITTCFSLHATKVIGCGEGGVVASNNILMLNEVRRLSTFGRHGTNAKLSEYHAAVALASLDKRRRNLESVSDLLWIFGAYVQACAPWGSLFASETMCNLRLPADGPSASEVQVLLKHKYDIETKEWYKPYLNLLPPFNRQTSPAQFPVTTELERSLLGLPFHRFLTRKDVDHVCTALKEIISLGESHG